MAPKKNKGKRTQKSKDSKKSKDPKKPPASQKSAIICTVRGPGPKYKLKPVVGYDDHCQSRYRNPAYSIAAKQNVEYHSDGPGPIYYAELPKAPGITIGLPQEGETPECRPGPYLLPEPKRTPAFSMRWRTPYRKGITCAGGLYDLPSTLNGPAFSITPKGDPGCQGGPGPSPPFSIDPIKPRAPAYSIAFRQTDDQARCSPGPYNPKNLDTSPAFTFGVKYHPCMYPNHTECDDDC